MEAKEKTAMVCLSEGMTLTHHTNQMTNFPYVGGTQRGTSVGDTFTIRSTFDLPAGFIDGGSGTDELVISGYKNDWKISKSGKTHFLVTEVDALYGTKEVAIQLQNVEKVQFMDGSFNLNRNSSETSASNKEQQAGSSGSSQSNVINISVDNSVVSHGGGNTNVNQNNDINVEVSENGATININDQNTNNSGSDTFENIFGSKGSDELIGSRKKDYLRGEKGNDYLYGNGGDDFIVGGKGVDYLEGGGGRDTFGISKQNGKGKRNYDWIADFEVGLDQIYVHGNNKGLWIDSFEGSAVIGSGKNNILAVIEGAGGELNWSNDGTFIA